MNLVSREPIPSSMDSKDQSCPFQRHLWGQKPKKDNEDTAIQFSDWHFQRALFLAQTRWSSGRTRGLSGAGDPSTWTADPPGREDTRASAEEWLNQVSPRVARALGYPWELETGERPGWSRWPLFDPLSLSSSPQAPRKQAGPSSPSESQCPGG